MKSKHVIAVCDDEAIALDVICSAVAGIFKANGAVCELERFSSTGDLEERMKSRIFDLLLLDIEMPGGSGMEFGRRLRAGGAEVKIIYVSNRTELVFESIETNPFAFVRKDHIIGDISAAMTRYLQAEQDAKTGANTLVVKKHSGIGSYRIDEIVYIESSRNLQHIHRSKGETIEVKSSLSDLEMQLTPHGFCRVHKSFIVNFMFVADLITGKVILRGGEEIPISRGKTPAVKLEYMKFLQRNNILIY